MSDASTRAATMPPQVAVPNSGQIDPENQVAKRVS